MRRTTVAEVMSAPVVSVAPRDSFAEVARVLHEAGVRAVPVLDPAGRLLGVVSEADRGTPWHRAELLVVAAAPHPA